MSERRHPWFLLAALALLLAPFAFVAQPALAAASYVVTSTADTGGNCNATPTSCTLRQAINSAVGDGQASTITFDFSGTDLVTIAPGSALPQITDADTTITGLLNVNTLKPRIIIDGSGSRSYGFSISSAASGAKIENLIFTGFRGTGSAPFGAAIYINGASGTTIRNNYIGNVPDVTYTSSQANNIGINVNGGSGSVIGGGALTDRNVISGNNSDGILFSSTNGATVFNNYIGVVSGGAQASPLGNAGNGVQVENSTNVTVGGTPKNIISANTLNGILVTGSSASTNTISYNYVGTDESGSTHGGLSFGNGGDGVRVENEAKTTTLAGAGNATATLLISNNAGYGVRVTTTASSTTISGAVIGLSAVGAALANQLGGVALLDDSTGTTLGPNNYISGNTAVGVVLKLTSGSYTSVANTTITGNYIGVSTNHTVAVANGGPGVDVQNGSTNTLIGDAGAGNFFAANTGGAIAIAGSGTISTTVRNNVLGLLSTAAAGDSGTFTVAATSPGIGVAVSGGATKTTIRDNRVASHSAAAGISLSGVTTATLQLNNIGYVGDTTPAARPNATGISLANVTGVDVLTNTLKFNAGDGISATDVNTVTLRSNVITDQSAGGDGIQVGGTSSRVKVYSNTLTTNAGFGVLVGGTAQRITIQYNQMAKNSSGGVSLQGTTDGLVTESDTANSPNHGIDPPIYDPVNDPTFASPLRLRLDQTGVIAGYVYTDTNRVSSCLPVEQCKIQFFAPEPTDTVGGQGYTPYRLQLFGGLTSDFVTPDAEGFFTARLVFPSGQNLPKQLIFAATDGAGNTSEFGVLNVDPKIRVAYVSPANGQQNAKPGDTITYTLSLVNEGTLRLVNVRAVTSNSLAGWTVSPPNGTQIPLTLDDHSSQPFTVTLTLPTGTDPNVRAGIQDFTSLFALVSGKIDPLTPSKVMTTTVDAAPVIAGQALKNTGSAPPNGTVTHTYRFTNSGNVTVTLDLAAQTIDPANSGYIWETSPSASTLEIPPGANRTVDVTVKVPAGAQTITAAGDPLIVNAVLTATGQAPYSSVSSVVSGTVGVDLVPSVQMGGNGQFTQAASSAQVSFNHSVTNTSNGPARFCLNSRSASGSEVVSYVSQNGVAIDSQGCFSLDVASGASPILRFKATINVTGILLPQDQDIVEIYLTSTATGKEVPNSTVTDTIEITSSPLLPRKWLPLIFR